MSDKKIINITHNDELDASKDFAYFDGDGDLYVHEGESSFYLYADEWEFTVHAKRKPKDPEHGEVWVAKQDSQARENFSKGDEVYVLGTVEDDFSKPERRQEPAKGVVFRLGSSFVAYALSGFLLYFERQDDYCVK